MTNHRTTHIASMFKASMFKASMLKASMFKKIADAVIETISARTMNHHIARHGHMVLGCLVVTMGLSIASTAWSQDSKSKGMGMSAMESGVMLPTMIASGRQLSSSILDSSVSATIVTESSYQNLGITNLNDLARFTPGLSYSEAFGRTVERPVIRGVVNTLTGIGNVESDVGYYIDGQYYGGDISSLDIYNYERIEVLRGPQIALFGHRSYAGAINFISRPTSDTYRAQMVATATDKELAIHADIAGPVSEQGYGYISFRHADYYGEYNNDIRNGTAGSEESYSLDSRINLDFGNDIKFSLRFSFAEDDDEARPLSLLGADQNNCLPGYRSAAYRAGASTNTNQYFCGEIPTATISTQDLNAEPFIGLERSVGKFAARTSFDVGSGHTLALKYAIRREDLLSSIAIDRTTNQRAQNIDGTRTALIGETIDDSFNEDSLEFTVTSPTDQPVRWSVGAYYYDLGTDRITTAHSDNRTVFNNSDTQNLAVFGTINFDLGDNLTGDVELRYDNHEKKLAEQMTNTTSNVRVDVGQGAWLTDADSLTWRSALNYRINENTSIYGSVARNAKPGGLNGVAGETVGQLAYEDELMNALEIGARTSANDGKISTNIVLFYNDIEDYQLETLVGARAQAGAGAQYRSVITNQGDAEIYGLEFDLNYIPADDMVFGISYAYTDAEITNGCDASLFTLTSGGFEQSAFNPSSPMTWNRVRLPIAASNTAPANDPSQRYTPGAGNCSLDGKVVPLTSKHQASANYRIGYGVSDDVQGFFNVNLSYESSKYVDLYNFAKTGETIIVGLQFGFVANNWTIRLTGDNITDEDSVPGATPTVDLLQGATTITTLEQGGIDTNAPYGLIRSLRKGREFGLSFSRAF